MNEDNIADVQAEIDGPGAHPSPLLLGAPCSCKGVSWGESNEADKIQGATFQSVLDHIQSS